MEDFMETEVILSRKSKSKNCKWHILTPSSPCDSVIFDINRYPIKVPVLHLRDADKFDSQQFYGTETITIRALATGHERIEHREFYIDTSDICSMCINHLRRHEKYLNRIGA
jgi:hypothetical protein